MRSAGLWASVAWLALTATLLPAARSALTAFVPIVALLLLGFLAAATRTVRWATLGRIFAASVAWALVAGTGALIFLTDAHTAVAEALWAGLGRECLGLLPLAALALAAPRRVRRLAVSDWLLLGLATGLAFQGVQALVDGMWAGISADPVPDHGGLVFTSTAVLSATIGLSVAGWRGAQRADGVRSLLLSGLSLVAPVFVGWLTVSASIEDAGLAADAAVPLPLRLGAQLTGPLPSAPPALLTGALLVALLVDARHLLATDAGRSDLSVLPTPWLATWWTHIWTERLSREPLARGSNDPDPGAADPTPVPLAAPKASAQTSPVAAPAPTSPIPTPPPSAAPVPLFAPPTLTGAVPPTPGPQATPTASDPPTLADALATSSFFIPLSTPEPPSTLSPGHDPAADKAPSEPNEDEDPDRERGRHRAAQSRTAGAKAAGLEGLTVVLWYAARVWRAAVLAICTLVAYVLRDKMVILASHAGVRGESRLTRLVRGRAAMEMTRHARREAYLTHSGPAGRFTLLTWRITAAAILVLLLAGVWWTQSVRTGPTVEAGWLTEYRAGLDPWWSGLIWWEQGLLVGGAIALVALSTASLGPAFTVCGAATYLASNGYGAATFVRSPRAAVRTYLRTATPGAVLADGAETLLTFVPITFGGAVDGRAVRATTDDYLRAFDLGGVSGYLTRAEPFSEFITRAIPVPGYYDVIVQADRGYGGGGFSSRAVARLILKDAIYAGGPVRLIPGRPGGTSPGSAQALADRLEVAVLAPSDTVFAFDSGRLVVGPSPLVASGQWITFEPGARQ